MKRKLILGFLLVAQATLAQAAGSLVDVRVVDDTEARVLQEYHQGRRVYVAGEPGHRYHLTLRNATSGPVLAVVSVDGVNVITGQTATYHGAGYVIPAYGMVDVTGWRKSLQEVARFYFTDLGDSYAARTGRPANVGVIGVAVFESHAKPVPPVVSGGSEMQSQAAPATELYRGAENRLGTGHGQREYSPVDQGVFRKATRYPAEVVSVRYDSFDNLVAQGVIRYQPRPLPQPQPFPGSFVPDPR